MSPIHLVLIGPPGVGKGTQAALLEERLGTRTLSSGVIFRQEIEAETDLGRLANSYIKRGELVPNGITIEMMAKRLRSDEVRRRGFVLDGFPRTLRQADALQELLAEMEIHLDRVVSLEIDLEVVVARLAGRMGCTKCGEIYHAANKPPGREGLCDKCDTPLLMREDDRPETVRERLRVFKENTQPVVEFYEARGLLRRIDANQTPEAVYSSITEGIL